MKRAIYQSKILFSPNKYTLRNKIFTEKNTESPFSGINNLHISTPTRSVITKNYLFLQKSTWRNDASLFDLITSAPANEQLEKPGSTTNFLH